MDLTCETSACVRRSILKFALQTEWVGKNCSNSCLKMFHFISESYGFIVVVNLSILGRSPDFLQLSFSQSLTNPPALWKGNTNFLVHLLNIPCNQ